VQQIKLYDIVLFLLLISSEFIKKSLVTSCEYEADFLENNLIISFKKQISDIENIIIPIEANIVAFNDYLHHNLILDLARKQDNP
jgi:hypothetical protein